MRIRSFQIYCTPVTDPLFIMTEDGDEDLARMPKHLLWGGGNKFDKSLANRHRNQLSQQGTLHPSTKFLSTTRNSGEIAHVQTLLFIQKNRKKKKKRKKKKQNKN